MGGGGLRDGSWVFCGIGVCYNSEDTLNGAHHYKEEPTVAHGVIWMENAEINIQALFCHARMRPVL